MNRADCTNRIEGILVREQNLWTLREGVRLINVEKYFTQFLRTIRGERVREAFDAGGYVFRTDPASNTRLVFERDSLAFLRVTSAGRSVRPRDPLAELGEQSNIRLPTILLLHSFHHVIVETGGSFFKLSCRMH